MGVVNATPDSFSDGGRFDTEAAAVSHALRLVAQGAAVLDIGGESTRPGAQPVDEAEELARVVPIIQRLARETAAPISVDTLKPGVARPPWRRARRSGTTSRRSPAHPTARMSPLRSAAAWC
jgi:dihydropteroate synthase